MMCFKNKKQKTKNPASVTGDFKTANEHKEGAWAAERAHTTVANARQSKEDMKQGNQDEMRK